MQRPLATSVLASHGRLLKCDNLGLVCEEEIICEPVPMETNSAACMWAALQQQLPGSIQQWFCKEHHDLAPKLLCVTTGSDHCAANEMMLAHWYAVLPPHALFLPFFCKQHATGNVLAAILKRLRFLNPVYCLAKRLRQGGVHKRYLDGLRTALGSKLRHIRGRNIQSGGQKSTMPSTQNVR